MTRLEFEDATPQDMESIFALECLFDGERRAPAAKIRRWLDSTFQRTVICWRRRITVDSPSGRTIVGYVVYCESNGRTRISRVASHAWHTRCGIGRRLLEFCEGLGRPLLLNVPEDRLDVQLWLRACGYRCVRIHRPADRDGLQSYEFGRLSGVASSR